MFGGVQVIQVIATIIRGKFVAIFLGTVGMGTSSLLVSSVTMMQTISALGLNYSAVREISKATESGDSSKLSSVVIVFLRWMIFSAFIGALSVIIFAPFLSNSVFGSKEYKWAYVCLSLLVLFNLLSTGFQILLQGTRRLEDLAKSNIIASISGLFIVVPFYYFFRLNGIVPALISSSAVSFLIYFLFIRKIRLEKQIIGLKKTINDGSEMVKLGIVMMLTGLMGTLTIVLITAFIKRSGSLSDVGLYQAGMSITNQSLALVFTAMGVDYFPRLSAVSTDSRKVRILANQQAEIMLLIITPIQLILILAAPLLIRVLLSEAFSSIANFIRLISLGMFFQAAQYAMGLISFAKGDKKTFFMLGIIGNVSWLFFSVLGYVLSGLRGISIFFVVNSIIGYLITYYTAYRKYNYLMSSRFMKLFLFNLTPMVVICSLVMFLPNFWTYAISTLILCCSLIYSIYKLNDLIGLKEMFYSFLNRFK
jgi:O-antigen/teichoic acid export membrane protein